MQHLGAFCLVALLAGCASPGLEFAGRTPVRVTVDGSEFAVWQNGTRAQAIRTNFERRPGIMGRAYRAIEQASGCRIRPGSFGGDPALTEARLSCSSAPGG